MYHYIRENSDKYPFSAHKKVDVFIEEILAIKKMGFVFKNPTDAISRSQPIDDVRPNKKVVILTFDDSLKDHLNAAKMLNSIGITSGCFYVPTSPYFERKVLAVHKAQFIRSKFGGKSLMLLEEASKKIGVKLIDHHKYQNEKLLFKDRYASQKDDADTKEFKRLINYYGDRNIRDLLLDEILQISNLKIHFEDIYLSEQEIIEISRMGFEIGSHGSTHTAFSRMTENEQYNELANSKIFLEDLLGKKITSFCYPYGGKSSYNTKTLELLRQLEYQNAISVEPRDISYTDIELNPFEIPRYDCNMIQSTFALCHN